MLRENIKYVINSEPCSQSYFSCIVFSLCLGSYWQGKILQLIGVTDQAEKDEVVKSVMDLKSAEIEDGYSMDAVISRQVGTWLSVLIYKLFFRLLKFLVQMVK